MAARRFLLATLLAASVLLSVLAHAAPAPLSDRGLENLVAFTRLLGYVRHFDPADSAVGTDWDAFAIAAVGRVERARNAEELARVLREEFGPLDPLLRVGTGLVAIDSTAAESDSIATWVHFGWNEQDSARHGWQSIGRVK